MMSVAQSTIVVNLKVRLPWWWRLYLCALQVSDYLGVVDADPAKAGAFIAKHTKFIADPVRQVDVRTVRYFERAPLGHHVHPDDLDLDRP